MGLRFRKTIKLGGINVNIGKKSIGASVGVKGARVGVGKGGTRASFSAPGTGFRYERKIGSHTDSDRSGSSARYPTPLAAGGRNVAKGRNTLSAQKPGCLKAVLGGASLLILVILLALIFGDFSDPVTQPNGNTVAAMNPATDVPAGTTESPKITESPQSMTATPAPTYTPFPSSTIIPDATMLKQGASGNEVTRMQESLISLGYLSSGQADGDFGNRTKEAVKVFQSQNGLTSDGIAGPETLKLLYSGNAKVAPTPSPTPKGNTLVWIPTNGGEKYHRNSTCSKMVNPKQVTLDKAKSLGFKPCEKCNPVQ